MTGHTEYKWLIDQLSKFATHDVPASRIGAHGHAERQNESSLPLTEEERARKHFLQQLDPEQKEMIAKMLQHSRISGIHDVACFLEGELSCGEMKLTIRGEQIEGSPYADMHFDLICRIEGDEWPDQ